MRVYERQASGGYHKGRKRQCQCKLAAPILDTGTEGFHGEFLGGMEEMAAPSSELRGSTEDEVEEGVEGEGARPTNKKCEDE